MSLILILTISILVLDNSEEYIDDCILSDNYFFSSVFPAFFGHLHTALLIISLFLH